MALPDPQATTTTGNMADALAGILDSFGAKPVGTWDSVEALALAEISDAGLTATVVGLQWGTLVLSADPHNAELLRWHSDAILERLGREYPGAVEAIRVNTVRV